MQHITSAIGLKMAIQQLENKRYFEVLELKKDFQSAYRNLNPFHLFRGAFDKAASTPLLLDNILGTTLGLAVGYLTKKIIIGKSGNKLRELIGSVVQYGLLNLIAQRTNTLKSIVRYVSFSFHRKKEQNTI